MIAFAHASLAMRDAARGEHGGAAAFAVADARSLPFRERFDRVVSFNALHWVPEQERALRSVRDALVPGGRTLLQLVPLGERRALEAVIEEVRESEHWTGFFPGFRRPFFHPTPDEYAALAARVGLAVEEIVVEPGQWDFGSRAAFVRFADATFVEWTRMLPADRHAAFVADVLDRYERLADGPADRNVFHFYQMEAVLRRV